MASDEKPSFDITPIGAAAPTPASASAPTQQVTVLPSPRRSTLHYFTNATRRSMRDTFSREQFVAGLKGFFWVAPLTVLIWIYAEREQLSELKNFQIPIEVRSANPRQVVTITRPFGGTVTGLLTGPRSQLDRVRDEFSRRSDDRARIELGTVAPGIRQVGAEAVADDERFAANGVMVSNLNPPVLEVFVDVLDDVKIEVEVPPSVTNLTSHTFDPPTVTLTAPRSVIEAAPKPLVAYVDPASLQQVKTPGRHQKVPVRLLLPLKDPNARLATTTVTADLEVKPADDEYTFAAIPVWPTMAPTMQQRYAAEFIDSLDNVTVIGPPEKIQAMREGNPPKASFEVTAEDEDAVDAPKTAAVRYDLPEGVKVKPEDAQRTVEFRLVPK